MPKQPPTEDKDRDREIYNLAEKGYSRKYICTWICRHYNLRRGFVEKLYDDLIHRDMRNVLVEKNPYIHTHEQLARHEILMCRDAISIAHTMLSKNYELWTEISDLVVELFRLKKERALSTDSQESMDLNTQIVQVENLMNEYSVHLPTLEMSIYRNLNEFRKERKQYATIHGLDSAVDWRQAVAVLIKNNMLPAEFATRLHSALSSFDAAVALADDIRKSNDEELIGNTAS